MPKIKNYSELINNARSPADQKARRLALIGLNVTLEAADPKRIVKSKVFLKPPSLVIDEKSFDLTLFKNIFVVGGGKASGFMAEALEEILGDYVTAGFLNIPYGTRGYYKLHRLTLNEASHPVPDEGGVKGTKQIMDLTNQANETDLIICLISGGGSSLTPLPCDEVSLEDKRAITETLLKSGATINEINAVRKHISKFKGGGLAKIAYPATIINLILSDVVGDKLDVIASGPTVPDTTTFKDAINVLKRYELWNRAPKSVRHVLIRGERKRIPETPKPEDKCFKKVYNFVLGNNRSVCLTAYKKFQDMVLNTLFLTAYIEGEAKNVGLILASIAREIAKSGNPIPKPAALIAGGETTVTVIGKGIGGRNQEIALAAAQNITGLDGVVVASINTDGLDGPTNAAGAIADGKTIRRSLDFGESARDFLKNNDSYTYFSKLDDLIFTGFTGTNVNDVSVTIVL